MKKTLFASALLTLSIGAYADELNLSEDLNLTEAYFPPATQTEYTTGTAPNGGLYDLIGTTYVINANGNNITASASDEYAAIGYRYITTSGSITELGNISDLGLVYDNDGNITSWTTQGFNGFTGGFTQSNGVLTVTDSVFTDNSTIKYTYYTAEDTTTSTDYYLLNASMTVTNSAFIGNIADSSSTTLIKSGNAGSTFTNSVFYANGGGTIIDIRWMSGATATVSTISNSIFDTNSGSAVVYNLASTLNIENSIFNNNSATTTIQSAVSGTSISVLNITNSEFTNNTGTNVVINSATGTVSGSTFDNNSGTSVNANNSTYSNTTITNSTFTNNSGTSVSNNGIMTITGVDNATDPEVFAGLTSGELTYVNTSTQSLFANNSGISVSNSGTSSQLTITNTTFENNSYTSVDNSGINDDESIISTTINDSIFRNNTSYSVYNKGTMKINDSIFENNTGGTVLTNTSTGTLTVNNTSFTGTTGSVDAIETSGTTTINNSTFTDNLSKGRAIDVIGGTTTVNNSTFDNNGISGAYGGAANISSNATLILNDSTFTNNTASQGGAIHLQASTGDSNIIFNVTQDQINYGNSASAGGFMHFKSQSSTPSTATNIATFNISEDVRMTIGAYDKTSDDAFGSGYTSGGDLNANIIKTGSGDLAINSSMQWYYGTVEVKEGTMYINQKLGAADYTPDDTISDSISARNAVTVSEGATLALRLENYINPLSSTSDVTLENNGTIILTAPLGSSLTIAEAICESATYTYTGTGVIKAYGLTYDDTAQTGYATYTKTTASVYSGNGTYDVYANSNNRLTVEGYDNFELTFYTDLVFSVIEIEAIDTSSGYIEQAFKVSTTNASDETSIMMSFNLTDFLDSQTTVYSESDFKIYNSSDDGLTWTEVSSSELDYLQFDGDYLEFAYGQENGYDNSLSWGWGYATAIPEPSTYAAIFGGLALGLAMYRRRK